MSEIVTRFTFSFMTREIFLSFLFFPFFGPKCPKTPSCLLVAGEKKKRDGGESLFDATSEKEKPTPKTHHELKERAQKRERERATRE